MSTPSWHTLAPGHRTIEPFFVFHPLISVFYTSVGKFYGCSLVLKLTNLKFWSSSPFLLLCCHFLYVFGPSNASGFLGSPWTFWFLSYLVIVVVLFQFLLYTSFISWSLSTCASIRLAAMTNKSMQRLEWIEKS